MSIAFNLIWLLPFFLIAASQSVSRRSRPTLILWLPQALVSLALMVATIAGLALLLAEEIALNFGPSTPSPGLAWLGRADALSASFALSVGALAITLALSAAVFWLATRFCPRRVSTMHPGAPST